MELDFALESKENGWSSRFVQLSFDNDYVVLPNMMLMCKQQIQQVDSIYLPAINQRIRLQSTYAKLCFRALMNCQNVVITLESATNQIYQCLNVAALAFTTRTNYPQALVVVKDDNHIAKLISHLNSQYRFDWRSSNNFHNSICYFSHSKLSDLKVPSYLNLLVIYGLFTSQQINKTVSSIKNTKTVVLLILTTDINIQNIDTKFSLELKNITEKTIKKYRQRYEYHEKRFDKCLQDLFCVSKIVDGPKVVLTTKDSIAQVKLFLKNNDIKIDVINIDRVNFGETHDYYAMAYGVLPPADIFEETIQFGESAERSIIETKKQLNIEEQSYMDPSSFLDDKKQTELTKRSFMKKPKETIRETPALFINLPFPQLQLRYNRTWVRLFSETMNTVKTPVVVMHAQNVRPPVKYDSIKRYIDNNKPVHINRQGQSDLKRLILINQELTEGCFNQIMHQIYKEKQKDRDFCQVSFYECQPVSALKLLQYLSRSAFMNRIDSLYQIFIIFSDDARLRRTIGSLFRQ